MPEVHQRTIIRVVAVAIAVVLSAQVFPWLAVAAIWPAASPLVAICAAGAARSVSLVSLVGLPLLVLALVRGRWFCHHLCPTGYLLILVGRPAYSATRPAVATRQRCGRVRSIAGRLSRRRVVSMRRFPILGPALCLVMLGRALVGFPLLSNLDPLVQFNGFFSVWRGADGTWVNKLPALSLVVLGLITAIWPHLWCERICPLGALQALLGKVGKACRNMIGRKSGAAVSPDIPELEAQRFRRASEMDPSRRALLVLAFGVGLGWVLKRMGTGRRGPNRPIRPPGAVAEPVLQGLCSRCGSCMRACPERIIVPDLGAGGPASWLTPRLDFSRRYCNEWCRVCTGVCPTGTIRRLSLDVKRALAIGTARVDRSQCLAWKDAQYCVVCHEFCSYQAVRMLEHKGVNCPEVDELRCRGCGSCQCHCPADPIRAIIVYARQQATVPANSGRETIS